MLPLSPWQYIFFLSFDFCFPIVVTKELTFLGVIILRVSRLESRRAFK